MSAEYAKRGSFSIVRKDLTGFGLELLCEARPVPDPNGLNCPSEPALRRLLHLAHLYGPAVRCKLDLVIWRRLSCASVSGP